MKKSNIFLRIFLTILFFLVLSISLFAQKEIPITTTSPEAKQLFIEARDRLENAEYVNAIKLLDQAITKDNTFASAYLFKSYAQTDPEISKEILKEAILYSGYASKGEQLMIEIQKYFMDNNFDKTIKLSQALIDMYPQDVRPLFYIGRYYYAVGELDNAMEYNRKALEINPNFAPANNIVGYIYMAKGDFNNSKATFEKYISILPGYANPYDSYGELLLKLGNYDEAIKNFQIAYDKDNSFQRALYMMGNAYLFKGEYNTAREYYRKFAEASNNPNSRLLAKRLKSVSYVYENNIDEALTNYGQYRDIAQNENNKMEALNTYVYEGLILCENGRTAEALDKYTEYNKRMNKMPLSWQEKASLNAYSNLDLAYAYTMNNDIEMAKEKVELAGNEVEKDNDIELLNKYNFTLGLIEYQQGNYNSAITIMKKIANPNCQQRYYLAQAYNKIGDIESAQNLCQQIKNLNESHLNSAVVWNKVKQQNLK